MTDNDIIQSAIKCCEPFEVRDIIAQQQDEIKRQKAEIERLENGIEELNCKLDMANDCIPEQRAEVIKEFADRLEKASYITEYIPSSTGDAIEIKHITMNQVRSIMKEMVGDSEC